MKLSSPQTTIALCVVSLSACGTHALSVSRHVVGVDVGSISRSSSVGKVVGVQGTVTPSSTAIHSPLFHTPKKIKTSSSLFATSSAATADSNDNEDKRSVMSKLRDEGGKFTINTKKGAFNLFGLYYCFIATVLGLVWFVELSACQFLYWLTRGKVDKNRRLPITFSHVWGVLLMFFTKGFPKVENREILVDLYQSKRPAMYVANHNSWLDIPYLGYAIGWKNYKMVAKNELGKVPFIGKAIKVGGNVMVDRASRKSQIQTLKAGMNWLKNGVNLCTFPEGTRSKTGRLMSFKRGAFTMAHKMGAPIVPLSIVGSAKVMPSHWLLPFRSSSKIAKVVVHKPIESVGKTEQELTEAVRKAIISGLPEEQRPLDGK